MEQHLRKEDTSMKQFLRDVLAMVIADIIVKMVIRYLNL